MSTNSLFYERMSSRRFTNKKIAKEQILSLISEATQAPTACNHQLHHFVIVDDHDLKQKLQKISGSNDHFVNCSHIIILCFQKGWNHNKFAVVQSTAAVTYNICLSAQTRGISSVWNAGIGNVAAVKNLLEIPNTHEVIGALCLGYPDGNSEHSKPPRKPVEIVSSYNRFYKNPDYLYPLRKNKSYKFEDIKNHHSKVAQHSPRYWTLAQIKTWRAFAVFAKSPVKGVYVSRRLGVEMLEEVNALLENTNLETVLEVLPYGGSYTALLRKWLDASTNINICELDQNNITFTLERIKNELGFTAGIQASVMDGQRLPYGDNSIDAIVLFQVLEGLPEYDFMLEECFRVLKKRGRIVVSIRNKWSWFGLVHRLFVRTGQVTNFGPYLPMNVFKLRRNLNKKFRLLNEKGISPSHRHIGVISKGYLRFFSRLWIASYIKE